MPFSITAPTLLEQEKFLWKSFTREDIPKVYELYQTVNRVDDNDYNETIADMEQQHDDPWSNPLTDARIIRTVQGKLAAFVRVFVNPQPEHENVAFLFGEVAPDARGQGLEQETLEWMEQRARERLAEAAQAPEASKLPRSIRVSFPESLQEPIALYNAYGYTYVRSFYKMELDLCEPIPAHTLPQGLTLRMYGEDIDDKLREAMNEAFRDHWGHQDITAEEWRPFFIDVSDFRRDLTLIVMDGDAIAAFSIYRVKAEENERLGIRRGWIGTLGTRRQWRKRGLATYLLAESMQRFKAEGFDSVGLGVDAENLTGALALYERIGFHAIRTRVVLEKKVQ
ncbi:MAG: GNAT family N-acetyltransferase [Chloroflexi bacterium]|nr:GNAT family N-acetyltransferase [Chloroflexota bacterium]